MDIARTTRTGSALRAAYDAQEPGFHNRRSALASAGHRREYGDLDLRERCSTEAVAVSGCGSDRRPRAASAHKPNAEDGLHAHNRCPSAEFRPVARPF